MEMYLIKSAACLAVLLLFYKLLLEKENMHVFKRYYLLTSVVAAIAIPLITLTTYAEAPSENLNSLIISSEVPPEAAAENVDYWPYIFLGIYLSGVIFFSIKFFRNLRSLIIKIRTNPKLRSNGFINVLLSEKIQPHTFFSFIFFNKEKYLQDEIPQDVKIHEEAHARQKHSLDVLFVELLQIMFWFNPLIFLLKDAVKLNHEFLADRAVIRKGIKISGYQQRLLAYSSRDLQCDLVNPINYSSTRLTLFGKTFSFGKFGQVKKRFTVMKTKTSRKAIFLRTFLLGPLLLVLLYSFSTTKTIERSMHKVIQAKNIQKKATPQMIAEYNRWAREMNASKDKTLVFEKEFVDRMRYIYSIMTPQQKNNAEKFPPLEEKVFILVTGDRDTVSSKAILKQEKAIKKELKIAEKRDIRRTEIEKEMIAEIQKRKEEKSRTIAEIRQKLLELRKEKLSWQNEENTPPPPPLPPAMADSDLPPPLPPSPPVPPKSEEHFKELAKQGATFYYGDKEISSTKAIQLVKNNKNLTIHVTGAVGDNKVKITDN